MFLWLSAVIWHSVFNKKLVISKEWFENKRTDQNILQYILQFLCDILWYKIINTKTGCKKNMHAISKKFKPSSVTCITVIAKFLRSTLEFLHEQKNHFEMIIQFSFIRPIVHMNVTGATKSLRSDVWCSY